jgi:hypothetical protein
MQQSATSSLSLRTCHATLVSQQCLQAPKSRQAGLRGNGEHRQRRASSCVDRAHELRAVSTEQASYLVEGAKSRGRIFCLFVVGTHEPAGSQVMLGLNNLCPGSEAKRHDPLAYPHRLYLLLILFAQDHCVSSKGEIGLHLLFTSCKLHRPPPHTHHFEALARAATRPDKQGRGKGPGRQGPCQSPGTVFA